MLVPSFSNTKGKVGVFVPHSLSLPCTPGSLEIVTLYDLFCPLCETYLWNSLLVLPFAGLVY
jgi:hypothetical protein